MHIALAETESAEFDAQLWADCAAASATKATPPLNIIVAVIVNV